MQGPCDSRGLAPKTAPEGAPRTGLSLQRSVCYTHWTAQAHAAVGELDDQCIVEEAGSAGAEVTGYLRDRNSCALSDRWPPR